MRSIELFAGCGGLALGVARAGFRHDLIIECDNDSVETLKENKSRKVQHVRHWGIEQCDTRDLYFGPLEGVDLLSGGPPCQPFSIGGKHLGPGDPRNMWPEAVRAVREIGPKAFVFENVRGIFRPDFSLYLDYIVLQLTHPHFRQRTDEGWKDHLARLRIFNDGRGKNKGDYHVCARAINAADYGAPQKRHRAIFIGLAAEYGDKLDFPGPTHSQEALAWSKHVNFDYWKNHGIRRKRAPSSKSEAHALERAIAFGKKPKERPWVTVRDAIGDLSPPSKRDSGSGHWQHPGATVYANHTGSKLDEPAKALKAGDHGVPGGENMLASRDGCVRYFTIREMARLQGFPDEFVVSGSWKAATRQLGNAVPVSVGLAMAKPVIDTLKGQR